MPKIGSIGIPELLIILVVVLLIFGPRRLPDMAKGLGQSVREFRKGLRDMRKEFDDESKDDADGKSVTPAPANPAAPVSAATANAAGGATEPAAAATDTATVETTTADDDSDNGSAERKA